MRHAAAVLAAVAAFGAAPAWAATDLTCPGHGSLSAPKGADSKTVAADYADEVRIHLDGATGTITLPDIMVPAPVLPYGRKKALWPLTAVQTSDEQIEADIVFDLVRRAHVRVSRIDGALSISGYDSFAGLCTLYNPAEVKKLF